MGDKLRKFKRFSDSLLPHEVRYLWQQQHFKEENNRSILEKILQRQSSKDIIFDTALDKRRYSNIKKWIEEKLNSIDVDVQLAGMHHLEQQINTDSITPAEEKQLLKAIKNYDAVTFYFTKFYELALTYRHYLLIRMRYTEYQLVEQFLERMAASYQRALAVNEQIHRATLDIVNEYAATAEQSNTPSWEQHLTDVFYDETIDGSNRYLAFVRLIFWYFNRRNFEQLGEKLTYLDQIFAGGNFYSKRLLINYYGNRLMYHARCHEWEQAEYFGYLSLQYHTTEYLYYVNNLCAVLVRRHKYQEAFVLLQAALPDMKTTSNYHSKIGFVAFYIKCLLYNKQYKQAENFAESFLNVYRKEIFTHRWHLFFSAYLETFLAQRKYGRLLTVVHRLQLMKYEKKYQHNANYLPTIWWYYVLSQYKEGELPEDDLKKIILENGKIHLQDNKKRYAMDDLLDTLQPHMNNIVQKARALMNTSGA